MLAGEELPETDSEESGFDLEKLKDAFKDEAVDADSVEAEAPEVTVGEELPETDSEESGFDLEKLKDAFKDEAVDADSVEAEAPEVTVGEELPETDSEESGFDLERLKDAFKDEAVEEETVADPELADEPALEIETVEIEESPVSEVTEELKAEQNITQKYLDELRSTPVDKPEEAEASVENNEDEDDESGGPSVESLLAANVTGISSEEVSAEIAAVEAAVEEAAVEEVATEGVAAEENPIEELPNTVVTADEAEDAGESSVAEVAEREIATSQCMPTMVLDSHEELVEGESLEGGDLSKLESVFNFRLQKLEDRIGGMFSSISDQINQLAESGFAPPQDQAAVDGGSEDEINGEPEVAKPETVEAPQPPVEDKIEVLKEQLKSKLREAEIELSINRAKLSQQRASIENMQADLERREAAVEAKLEQAKKTTSSGEKKGIMDRWKRHLGE